MDGPIEANRDAIQTGGAPDQGAYGPTVGFIDGIQTSFRQTTEVTNQLAQETALRDREQSQIKRIREAGGAAPPSLNDVEDDGGGELPYATTMNGDLYRRTGRLYGGTDDGSQDSDVAEALGRRNAKLTELQKQYPQLGIQTYDQMFSDTQAKAKELTDTLDKSPTSLGGKVGEFVGGMVGSMSPRTAPVTFGTLGVPIAEGASLATRAVTQGAAAGGGDVISQVTGGDEGRGLLLGDDGGYRFGQTAEAVAGGAGGELAIAGAAKAFGFGFRAAKNKLFPDADIAAPERIEPTMDKPGTPPDPGVTFQPQEVYGPAEPMDPRGFRYPNGTKFDKAGDPIYPDGISFFRDPANMRPPDDLPRVSPLDSYEIFRSSLDDYTQQAYGSSRLSAALAQIENANVTYQLGAWDGPAPWEVAPRTAATPVPDVTHVNFGKPLTKLLAGEGPEAIARRIDPDTFAQVDRLNAEMDASRARLDALRAARDTAADKHVEDLSRQIDAARERAEGAKGKRRGPAQEKLDTLIAFREEQRARFLDAASRPEALRAAPLDPRAPETVEPTSTGWGRFKEWPPGIHDPSPTWEEMLEGMRRQHEREYGAADELQGGDQELQLHSGIDGGDRVYSKKSGVWVDVGAPYSLNEAMVHTGQQLREQNRAGGTFPTDLEQYAEASHLVMQGVFKKMKKGAAADTKVYVVPDAKADTIWPNNKAGGWYEPNRHYIILKESEMQWPARATWITGHEGAHAAYFWALETNADAKSIVDYMVQSAKQFAADNSVGGFKKHYGYTNAHEYISEALNNPTFARYLGSVPAPTPLLDALEAFGVKRSSVKTLWDGLIQVGRKLFGLPENQTSLLEATLRFSDVLSALREERGGQLGHAAGSLSAPQTAARKFDTPPDSFDMATERANLIKFDEQQRDLAPLVSRAFHAANNEWSAGRYDPDTIRFFKDLEAHPRMRWKEDATVQPSVVDPAWRRAQEGATRPPERPSIAEQVPELATRPDIVQAQGDKPAVDTVQKILDENRKTQEPEIERFQQKVSTLLKEDKPLPIGEDGVDPNVIRINNVDLHLDKDKMFIPTEDGDGMKEVNVRTFLKDLQQDTDAYKAIGTCSRS